MLKKIVVIGPESTGKSSLCQQLATHFGSNWCAEYAREYLLQYGTSYSFENLLAVAKGQARLEERALAQSKENRHPFLFIDTDQYVMKVWCEYVFGRCHTWILNSIVSQQQDLYLLCKPDLPWVKDELREYPDEKPRQELYHIYRDILVNQSVQWAEIKGDYEERFQMAVDVVNQLVENQK